MAFELDLETKQYLAVFIEGIVEGCIDGDFDASVAVGVLEMAVEIAASGDAGELKEYVKRSMVDHFDM